MGGRSHLLSFVLQFEMSFKMLVGEMTDRVIEKGPVEDEEARRQRSIG